MRSSPVPWVVRFVTAEADGCRQENRAELPNELAARRFLDCCRLVSLVREAVAQPLDSAAG